ncbi:MAG TPA: hypothetical protein VM925_14070 [Labilithrix sp.]|nr:hypothetical protein [Labilithrix sp.]
MSDGVLVRVVDVGERRALGWAVALSAGLGTAAILLHLWAPHVALGISQFWSFGIASAIWAGGTLLQWRRRPWVTTATVSGDALYLGRRRIPLRHITGVKVARGQRGFSVAVGDRWRGGQFVEVEREAEARRLVEQLGIDWPGTNVCTFAMRSDRLRSAQQLTGVIGVVSALSYAIAIGGLGAPDLKSLFGFPALGAALLASVFFVLQPLLRSSVRIGGHRPLDGRGDVMDHLGLHQVAAVSSAPFGARETAVDPRIRILDRGQESTSAWLERVDSVVGAGAAYRSDALSVEELRQVADSGTAPVQARLGALRLLARRHGGVPKELRERVTGDLGARVRVVIEPNARLEEAADELEALGPAFRARVD